MKKDKDFDAVDMMRSIRSKLQEKYDQDPDLRKKRLKDIRKKIRSRSKRKILANT